MEYAIEVHNLCKKFNLYKQPQDRLKEAMPFSKKIYHQTHEALKNISFKVARGETIGIIGKNGAGKSTLLKMITGVATPTSGTIKINGEVAALLELGTGFNPEYNGYQNIYLNGIMRGYSKEDMDEKIQEIIDFADIGSYIEQPVKTYSSGMFARLAFSVMVNFKPEILIVDEALSVGDVFFQQKCNTYMKEKMKDVTKLLVTHDMNSVANMADRVILLDKGEIIQDGKPLDVIQNYLKIIHTDVYAKKYYNKNENKISATEIDMDKSLSGDTNWVPVEKSDIGGAGDAFITECYATVNEHCEMLVKPNDKISIYFKVVAKKDIDDLIIGYIFKDKYGNSVIGENSIGSNVIVTPIKKAEEAIYRIEITWPAIKEGDYFITIGLGEGTDQMVHTIQCWAHNVIHVEAMALEPMHGIINNKIKKITKLN